MSKLTELLHTIAKPQVIKEYIMWDILNSFVGLIGPELKKALYNAVLEWEKKVTETKTKADDFAVAVLKALLA